MSVKTRIEALEKRLAKPEPEETVVRIQPIIVRTREEVVALKELERAKHLDSPAPPSRPIPRGRVRIVELPAVEAKDLLVKARAVSTQDEGQADSDARES
jgi:hypothetical protein